MQHVIRKEHLLGTGVYFRGVLLFCFLAHLRHSFPAEVERSLHTVRQSVCYPFASTCTPAPSVRVR
ncbi:hypothetical protein HMPREF3190_01341 [Umbribacter vaginalis]|nr:hypothetical protein HMPREF3190_01341 [Coriobacteriales bacterium DNF00809]